MAPRLAVAFGLDRSRYDEAREVQQYSGIAPVIEKSGNKSGYMHDGAFPPSFTRPSMNSQRTLFHIANGQEPSTMNNENAAPVIMKRSAYSPSDGFAFSFVFGKQVKSTMTIVTSRR